MSNENLTLGLENFLQVGEITLDIKDPGNPGGRPGDQLCYGVVEVERE